MKKLFSLLFVLTMMVGLVACSKNSASEPAKENKSKEETFVIGVIPTQNQGDMQKAMDKLGAKLSEKINRPVKMNVFPDYNAVVEAMNFGKVDMAYYGPLTYVIAQEKSGAEAIMTMLVDDQPFYYSYLITHKDSPLTSMEDVVKNAKDISFAFGDPNSTSGSLIPSLALKDKGIFRSETDSDFKTMTYTGGHDATAKAVQSKKIDVGAIDSAIFDSMKKNKVVDESQFKVIWQSEKLFQYPWAVKKGTSEEIKSKLQEAFAEVKDKEILDVFGASGFTKASDKDYESIREAARKAGKIK